MSDEKKEIRITCRGAGELPYEQLVPFQGNLKNLSNENYQKLRKEILELGFSEPISVWRNDDKVYVLNGHQRLRTIKEMVEDEGYTCPPLPVSFVEADNLKQAKLKVLALTSQYGEITATGLSDFLVEADIDPVIVADSFRFPELDPVPVSFMADKPHDDPEATTAKTVTCPECGYEFTP